jgi:5-methylcytosine-specific restriction protein A
MIQMFIVGEKYTKNDIYGILDVPVHQQKGAWDTGYREYQGNFFIFSNVGIPGRTGHDYNNYWDGDEFVWEAKNKSNIRQPLIQKMISPSADQKIYLFTRTEDRLPFTYEGNVAVKSYFDTSPVKIIWAFEKYPYETLEEKSPTESNESPFIYEGRVSRVSINKYERNPLARRMCIEHFGCFCNVCKFDFYITYGDLGKGFTHVHHIIPISEIGEYCKLTPEKDLIPVCPNCHSMLHKTSPPINPKDLKDIVVKQRKG